MTTDWKAALKAVQQEDLFRDPPLIEKREDSSIVVDGKTYLDFSSNDSLGLGQAQYTIQAQSGAGASRLVTGNLESLVDLESVFARWMGFESALLFPSGYQANLSLISGLFNKEDLILSDQRNHASIVDGIRLSGARKKIFPHADLHRLQEMIEEEEPTAIVVESLYSVDGDFFPLSDLLAMIKDSAIVLIVDEAHACGVYGNSWQGCLSDSGGNDRLIKVATCSKAIGAQGAMVLMSAECRQLLINKSRGFIYGTGVSPVLASLIFKQIKRIQEEDLGQVRLKELSLSLDKELRARGYDCGHHSGSHILTLNFEGHEKGRQIRDKLKESGIWVAWLRYPTVPKGCSRIRISLNTSHRQEDLQRILMLLTP